MTRILFWFSVGLFFVVGCNPPLPKPVPDGGIDPPAGAVNVVVVCDVKGETPEQARIYTDKELIDYLSKGGHELRICEKADKASYLKPYVTEAAKIGSYPVEVIGRKGKVLHAEACPDSTQGFIAAIQKVKLGGPQEDGWFWGGGEFRKFGCLPVKPGAEKRWPTEGEDEPLVPEREWKKCDFRFLAGPVISQGAYSACAACSTTSGLIVARNRAGLKLVELSVVDCYSRGNNGRDAGMTLEDALDIAKAGICTTEYAAMWGVKKCNHRDGFETDRKRNRVLRANWCPTVEHVGSAVQRRRPVVFGIMVTDDFQPDRNGLVGPKKKAKPRGGHAMLIVGLESIGQQTYFVVKNSWGTDWGTGGYCLLHASWLEDSAFGAWSIAAVYSPDNEPLVRHPASTLSPRTCGRDRPAVLFANGG